MFGLTSFTKVKLGEKDVNLNEVFSLSSLARDTIFVGTSFVFLPLKIDSIPEATFC